METTNEKEIPQEGNDEYIDMNTAVEVKVEDAEPMESDDEMEMEDEMNDDLPERILEDESMYKIKSHNDSIYNVSIDVDGCTVCSGGGDDVAYLHKLTMNNNTSITSSSNLLSYKHKDSVSCSTFANDILAVGSYDGIIQIYNKATSQHIVQVEGPSDIEFLKFHPNSNATILMAGSSDGTLWLFHLTLPSYKCLQVFVGHANEVIDGAFTSNGKFILSGGVDGTVKLWNPKTGVCKHTFAVSESRISCLDLYRDLLLVGCEDGNVSLVHVKNKKILCVLPHATNQEEMVSIESVGFLQLDHFNWCATAGSDGIVKIWDLSLLDNHTNLTHRVECNHNTEESVIITRMKWHKNLPILFTTGNNGNVYIWDGRNGTLLKMFTTSTACINDLDVWFDGNKVLICVGCDDCFVRFFYFDCGNLFQS